MTNYPFSALEEHDFGFGIYITKLFSSAESLYINIHLK